MNSFIRRTLRQTAAKTVAIAAIGAGFISSGLVAQPAQALTQDQIADRLSGVPVFVIGIGNELVSYPASPEAEGGNSEVLFVFMSEQDAESYIALTRTNEEISDLPPEAEVGVQSLEYLYKLENASQAEQAESRRPLRLVYVPEDDEASQAAALNTGYQRGVPLFYPQFEDGSLVPVEQNDGGAIFPMFFSRADLESLLSDLGERNAEARAAVSVGVVPLEAMLIEMKNSDDELLNQVRLLPDSDTINEIQQNLPQGE
ncbi:MAG: Tic22 family protein [Phormidesmis sp.]